MMKTKAPADPVPELPRPSLTVGRSSDVEQWPAWGVARWVRGSIYCEPMELEPGEVPADLLARIVSELPTKSPQMGKTGVINDNYFCRTTTTRTAGLSL